MAKLTENTFVSRASWEIGGCAATLLALQTEHGLG